MLKPTLRPPFQLILPLTVVTLAVLLWRNDHRPLPVDPDSPRTTVTAAATADEEAAGNRPAPVDPQAAFASWLRNYRAAAPTDRAALVATGAALATARQTDLARVMRQDPERIDDLLLPLATLAELPEAVRACCEQPFNAMGSIDLRWSTSIRDDGSLDCQYHNLAYANGKVWPIANASFSDARQPQVGVPLDGHVIAGELLLDPRPLRVLGKDELAAAATFFPAGNADRRDPVTGGAADATTAAVVGGRLYRFEKPAVLQEVEQTLRTAVQSGARKLAHGLTWLEAEGGDPVAPGGTQDPVAESPWLSDVIDVLFIRVDFSDFQGAPVTQADLQAALGTVSTHLHNYSYGAASLVPTVTSQLYRMPATGSSYAKSTTGNDDLLAAARSAAAANYTLANYDVVAVYFPNLSGVSGSKITYGGLASVGGSDHWINGVSVANRVPVMLHEFGHNYGLYHANYWDPTTSIAGSYLDPALSSLEYGDIFDRMGNGNETNGYFSPYATNRLNWLSGSKIVQPAADGTWRVFRFDYPTATNNATLALKIPLGGGRFYWVGHRKLYPAAPYNLATAAYVVGDGFYTGRPNLIDMTPGSQSPEEFDRNDAGLPVGSTYHDAANGVHLTTMASGGTAPNEWIEVKVDFDPRIEIVTTTLDADEKSGNAVVTLRRGFDSAAACSVNYATSPGTATAGTDYLAVSGTVRWAAGETADKSILVPIRPDGIAEGTETFSLTLSSPVGAVLVSGGTTATIQIRDAGQLVAGFTAPFLSSSVYAIVPLTNGKVLIGGNFSSGLSGHLARLNADGSEDATFLKGTGFDDVVRALVLQPDGRILVGGDFTSYNGTLCNHLVRLGSDGAVETAFVTAMGTGADWTVRAIALESSGGILVGGEFGSYNGIPAQGVVRLLATGARDATNPLNTPYSPSFTAMIFSILVQPDGKIMTAGSFHLGWNGTGFRSGVARLNSNGTNDASFNPDAGAHLLGNPSSLRRVETLVRQPDGKYIIGGQFSAYDENAAPCIARINSNGSFDGTFVPPSFNTNVTALLLQPSGNVVVGGWFTSPVEYLERLLPGGGTDLAFNQGTGPGGSVYALARDASGTLWVGGNFYTYNGTTCRPIIKVSGGLNAYEAWADTVFSPAQVFAGQATATADPDADGRPNIAELLLGSNPNSPAGGIGFAPVPIRYSTGSAEYLQTSLNRAATGNGLWVMAQFSNDLTTWTPAVPALGPNAVYDLIEDTAAQFTIRDKTAAATSPRRFVRILVTTP